jgi:predicted ATPase with chaperone activity
MTTATIENPTEILLPAPLTLQECGLKLDTVVQLLVKTLHFAGEATGIELGERIGLPFSAIEPAVDFIKAQHLSEIVGGTSLGPPSYRHRITVLGRERAGIFLDRNMYTGIAPVPLDQYTEYMKRFAKTSITRISRKDVAAAFSHLVLSNRVLDQVGPAVSAGHSLFIYGAPGNGKTVIAQGTRDLLPGDLWIPHAIEVEGSLIQVFDQVNHEPLPRPTPSHGLTRTTHEETDRRWERCKRPLMTVGGELTLEGLELTYNPTSGFYQAPVQLKSNGGVLLIDDFGRQKCSPQALLNRWITPLEGRTDYLTLQSGQKVAMPFMTLPVFATNLKPTDLVDEAFLRRIQYKVQAESPTPEDFAKVFQMVCRDKKIEFDPAHVEYLLRKVYEPRKIPFRGCHPRDLINQALLLAQYRGDARELTTELLEEACATYFVDRRTERRR